MFLEDMAPLQSKHSLHRIMLYYFSVFSSLLQLLGEPGFLTQASFSLWPSDQLRFSDSYPLIPCFALYTPNMPGMGISTTGDYLELLDLFTYCALYLEFLSPIIP